MAVRVAADSSVVIAGLLSWHEHHGPAHAALERALEQGTLIIPTPALVESYSVMTRLPAPHRLRPADAHQLLHDSFFDETLVESLTGRECWATLARLAGAGIAGGRVYDAQILAVALKHEATVLLTLNAEDFTSLAPEGLEVRNPLA